MLGFRIRTKTDNLLLATISRCEALAVDEETGFDRLVFGSLIYPTRAISYRVSPTRDVHHFLRQVFQRLPRRAEKERQLMRLFAIDENDKSGIHFHFILESPNGFPLERLIAICQKAWASVALREKKAAAEWRRLHSLKVRWLAPADKKTILIKNGRIVREPKPMMPERRNPVYSSAGLADVTPLRSASKSVNYCLKLKREESRFAVSRARVQIKGHSLDSVLL